MQISRLNCIAHKSLGQVGEQRVKGKVGKRGKKGIKTGRKTRRPKKKPAGAANLRRSIRKRKGALKTSKN